MYIYIYSLNSCRFVLYNKNICGLGLRLLADLRYNTRPIECININQVLIDIMHILIFRTIICVYL